MPKNTLVRWVIETLGIEKRPIKDYFCRCRGAVITGLAYTQWFVDVAVVQILITYFTDTSRKNGNFLPLAVAAIVKLLGGLSSVLEFPMTYISDKHVSPLKVILSSVAAYIIGMVMLCIAAFHRIPGDMTVMYFVPVVLLIAVGKAGGVPILEQFLVGQLTAHEPKELEKDEGRVYARKTVWWITTSLLCKLSTPWIFSHASWPVIFICSTSVMGIGYLLFLGCIPLYYRSVDDAAAANTDLESAARWEGDTIFTASDPPPMDDSSKSTEKDQDCSTVNEEEEGEEEEEEGEGEGGFCLFIKGIKACWDYIAPILRAEKATEDEAIRELEKEKDKESASNNGPAAVVCAGRSLVEQCKPLSVMIPMWTTFLVFGLVLSTEDTFFTEQGNNMDPTVSIYVVIYIGKIIKTTSSFFTAILLKCVPKPQQMQGIIVGIWTAMVLSVFCCSVAWRFEIRRLRAIEESNFCVKVNEDDYAVIPMSILRLAPQFCLLGLMEGTGKQGLDLFFEAQVPDVPMKKYGSALNDAVVGCGNFLNALLVFCIKSWFGDTLDCSRTHLDRYYQMLMIMSFLNLCYYWFVSTFYPNKKETKDSVEVRVVEIAVQLLGKF